MSRSNVSFTDLQNPLFIHPSDGVSSLAIGDKLIGAANYRTWRRNVEIGLSTKRKLCFVLGTLPRPTDDLVMADQWDACNNLVIAWLANSVTETISRSILYIQSAREIWIQLERRFCVSNGARKFKLNRDVHGLKQGEASISDYYTKIRCVWEELDNLMMLPKITVTTEEITTFLNALRSQQEEQKLFQFLNGLHEDYSHQRSQILMMNPLPSVEMVCSMLQQEETQREMLDEVKPQFETTALLSKSLEENKNAETTCSHCGNKGHQKEKCWQIIGYPSWHPKSKKLPQKKGARDGNFRSQKGKWNKDSGERGTAAQVYSADGKEDGVVTITKEQIEQLLRLLPQTSRIEHKGEEDFDNFAGLCHSSP